MAGQSWSVRLARSSAAWILTGSGGASGVWANARDAANRAAERCRVFMGVIVIPMKPILPALFLTISGALWAADELTVYDLLPPSTHSFDIIYDVTANREGAAYFFNPIRPGSIATKERVIDRATGKPLEFATVDGKTAKASGGVGART